MVLIARERICYQVPQGKPGQTVCIEKGERVQALTLDEAKAQAQGRNEHLWLRRLKRRGSGRVYLFRWRGQLREAGLSKMEPVRRLSAPAEATGGDAPKWGER